MDDDDGLAWSKNPFLKIILNEIKDKKILVCGVILEVSKVYIFQKALGRMGFKPFL